MTQHPHPTASPPAYVGARRLHRALARWADEQPAAEAVRAGDGRLDFAGLHHRVAAMAGELAAAGVARDSAVGIGTGRSHHTVATLLATWQLGACAVPLDDRHPPERLNGLLRDAQVRVLVASALPAGLADSVIRVNPAGHGNRAEPQQPLPECYGHPEDRAYIIYTSGTTGRPKGVEIRYGGLDAFLAALSTVDLKRGGLGINAVSPAFDGWLWCTLLYLLHGQGVALVDPAREEDIGGAIEAVEPVTVSLTPSLLASCDADLSSAEVLVVAGEACPPVMAARYGAGRRMLNVYGPTEATIAATWSDSARGDDVCAIGRPLPGYHAYVVDDQLDPIPDGVVGELCIGGAALARGYRGMPGLTAARFVPDPFAGAGSRMYRTGDLVSRRPDGQLDYHGRGDGQAKLRGYRVEPSEVDRVAVQVPGVAAACCVVLPTDTLGLALLAESGVDPGDLVSRVTRFCADVLPDFMRPSIVDVLPAWPLGDTGKIDRASLAAQLDGSAAGTRGEAHRVPGRGPWGDREREVCQVWEGLLARPVPDVDASFFELGGHSLLAARAVVELRRRSGLALSMRHLLANPTVASLAQEMDLLAERQQAARSAGSATAPAVPGAS
jgi:amino acid adenylation domain-containing protein